MSASHTLSPLALIAGCGASDWTRFAQGYNRPDFRINYDTPLATYEQVSRGPLPV